jgi:exodeoxyribonuclease VII large subunit
VATAVERVVAENTKTVWVAGEVTNLRRAAGGRMMFLRLRDAGGEAQIDATIRLWQTPVTFDLADGAVVRVRAKPEFVPKSAALWLHVYEIAPHGEGTLLAQIRELRRRLDAEGLFSPARKKEIPFLPRKVGLVTARDGAVRHDVEETLKSRCSCVDLVVVAALMQGPGCAGEVVAALRHLDADPTVDVIVVARGGGSLEDLMGFNDERVARAIAACRTPVVAAIGHERDVTIACDVADRRAMTPTAAAAMVAPDAAALLRELASDGVRARHGLARLVARVERELAATRARPCLSRPESVLDVPGQLHSELGRRLRAGLLAARDRAASGLAREAALLPRSLRAAVLGAESRVTLGRDRLVTAGLGAVTRAERALELASQRLLGRDPTRPLREGFALVTGPDGHVVPNAHAAVAAHAVRLRFADGAVAARVEGSVEEATP